MMNYLGRLFVFTLLAVSVTVVTQESTTAPQPIAAQDDAACTTIVRDAVSQIGSSCAELGRDEACYGHTDVIAELTDDTLAFDADGDIVGVETLTSLVTGASDPDTGAWGVALLDIRADLPEASSNNVRLVLFGGVEVQPTPPAGIDADAPTCTVTNTIDENINLRVGPDTTFSAVDRLAPGDSLTAYGVSSDGQWIRAAEGWLFAPLTENNCAANDVPVINEASEGYFQPMQNFSLTLGAAGACDAAPDGLLVQAPTGTTANVMVNGVELRLGSTAFVTLDRASGDMIVASFDGDVVTTADGLGRRLRVGEETTIPLSSGLAAGDPTFPRPFTAPAQLITADILSLLPESISVPTPAVVRGSSVEDALTIGSPGRWLGCGSCESCGDFPTLECVTSPDGTCLWDPATCRNAFITQDGQSLKGPDVVECTAGTPGTFTLVYADRLGENFLATAFTDGIAGTSVANVDQFVLTIEYTCPSSIAETTLITAQDTLGNVLLWQTTFEPN